MLARAQTVFHTLKYLSLRQALYLFIRRVMPVNANFLWQLIKPDAASCEFRHHLILTSPVPCVQPGIVNRRFCFLNAYGPITDIERLTINWRCQDMPKLWRYNLHYFDYLCSPAVDDRLKEKLIDSWIHSNPVGTEDAWEPYPVSLRIVNWIKYFSELSVSDNGIRIKPAWIDSLSAQVEWLNRNMEYHIRANHLLKNYVAMVYGACFLKNLFSGRKRKSLLNGFYKECVEQFLDDGGHYERSPMYHCIALEDLMDVYNLLCLYRSDCNASEVSSISALCEFLKARIDKGMEWLGVMTLRDGKIALFADSAFAIAPEPQQLQNYWQRLSGRSPFAANQGTSATSGIKATIGISPSGIVETSLASSGYLRKDTASYSVIVNVGEPGPAYQPGHTHCDLFSYELTRGNQRLFVDTGVYEYSPGYRRHYARSTAAHNTLQINGAEQHQIWGEFRVGRRARVTRLDKATGDKCHSVDLAHNGYESVVGGLETRRTFRFELNALCICDAVVFKGTEPDPEKPLTLRSWLHLGPGFSVQPHQFDESDEVVTGVAGDLPDQFALAIYQHFRHAGVEKNRLVALIKSDSPFSIDAAEYFSEFGKVEKIDCICFEKPVSGPGSIRYRIIMF